MKPKEQILIRVDAITPRIKYIFHHVFENILGIEPVLTLHNDEYKNSKNPKLNYSLHKNIQEGLNVYSIGLLYKKGIDNRNIPRITYTGKMPIIFEAPSPSYKINFDIFSAIFYVLSRYEEFLSSAEFDAHGRFLPERSIFYESNLLEMPVVDEWIAYLKVKLMHFYPQLTFKHHQYVYLPTIDVDYPFAFQYKKLYYSIRSIINSVFHFNIHDIAERIKVMIGKKNDPYDTYDFINNLCLKYSIQPIYFYLCNGKTKYDESRKYRLKGFKEVIKKNKFSQIGIHNSYNSLNKPSLVQEEQKLLSHLMGEEVLKSRFHYIRFKLSHSYRNLIEAGIIEDYSMGYPSVNGFRAGTSHPFYFYDLLEEATTNLKVIPFQAMDATYIHYLKKTPEDAKYHMEKIRNKVKEHGGTFVVIWHNNTFAPTPAGKEWRNVFKYFFE